MEILFLNISVKTVEKHRVNLMKKHDLQNVTALTWERKFGGGADSGRERSKVQVVVAQPEPSIASPIRISGGP